jgi:hypothetical protein
VNLQLCYKLYENTISCLRIVRFSYERLNISELNITVKVKVVRCNMEYQKGKSGFYDVITTTGTCVVCDSYLPHVDMFSSSMY